MGGGGGRGGGAEVRWWRRWPRRAWPALRCSELGAEPRSLALSGSLDCWLAPRSLTARRPALALPTRGGGKRRPGAAPPTAHAWRASVCIGARARASWDRSALSGGARGASLGPLRCAERRCAAPSGTRVLRGPCEPGEQSWAAVPGRSWRCPAQEEAGRGGSFSSAACFFSSLFLGFLLPLFSPPLLPLVVLGLLLFPPSSSHSFFPAHTFLFLGWKFCPGGTRHGSLDATLLSRYIGNFSSNLDAPAFLGFTGVL